MFSNKNNTISCGVDHSVVLLSDGNIRCWGDNAANQCDPMHITFTDVVQVACGWFHSVALLTNGTVRCWGDNRWNQCDPIHLTFTNVMMPPCNCCMLW